MHIEGALKVSIDASDTDHLAQLAQLAPIGRPYVPRRPPNAERPAILSNNNRIQTARPASPLPTKVWDTSLC